MSESQLLFEFLVWRIYCGYNTYLINGDFWQNVGKRTLALVPQPDEPQPEKALLEREKNCTSSRRKMDRSSHI